MFRQQKQSDNRGQVGIQTLIIFIALIAVAAITAGILLETANVLQEDADRTGDEASEQVTDRLEVVEVLGDTDGDGEEVTNTRFQVSLPAGADSVDLDQVQLSVVTGEEDEVYTDEIDITELAGDFEDNVLSDREHVAELEVEQALDEGETAEVTLRTGAGAETHKSLMVPDPITEEEGVVSLD